MTDASGSPERAVLELLSSEGDVEREVWLDETGLTIGRETAQIEISTDGSMAPVQARITASEGGALLQDLGGGSGVWLRLRGAEGRLLEERDQLWLGAQLLQVQRDAGAWTLRHHGPDGRFRAAHPVPETGLFIGRTSDLVLDPEDGRLSRRHAQIVCEGDALRFHDRGAHNGSWLRLTHPEALSAGDEFRVGVRRFRLAMPEAEAEAPEVTPVASDTATGEATILSPSAGDAEATILSPSAGDAEATILSPSAGEAEATILSPSAAGEAEATILSPSVEDGEATVLSLSTGDAPEGAEEAGVAAPDASERAAEVASPRTSGLAARLKRLVRGTTVGDEAEPDAPEATPKGDDPAAPPTPGIRVPEPEAPAEVVRVVLDDGGESVTLEGAAGRTVLEIVQAASLERGRFVDWECGDGGCGVCVLAVVEGADRLDPPDPKTGEMKTIQITEQVAPDPNRYRLACLARVRGGVVHLRKMP